MRDESLGVVDPLEHKRGVVAIDAIELVGVTSPQDPTHFPVSTHSEDLTTELLPSMAASTLLIFLSMLLIWWRMVAVWFSVPPHKRTNTVPLKIR